MKIIDLVGEIPKTPSFIPTHILKEDMWKPVNELRKDWIDGGWDANVQSITKVAPDIVVVNFGTRLVLYKGKLTT